MTDYLKGPVSASILHVAPGIVAIPRFEYVRLDGEPPTPFHLTLNLRRS